MKANISKFPAFIPLNLEPKASAASSKKYFIFLQFFYIFHITHISKRSTQKIALVLLLIFLTKSVLTHQSILFTSTNIGFAPHSTIGLTVAVHVDSGTITSSPFLD